jgi:hypothetical protein
MRTSRRLLLALSLSLAFAATFLAAPQRSQAATGTRCGNEFYYYDGGGNLVGYEVWDCNCYYSSWGIRTIHRVIEPLGC